MLVDDVIIEVTAGRGGRGAVAFNKTKMSLGPVGGSGGNGGSVYAQSVVDLGALKQFRYKKSVIADNGEDGHGQSRDGSDGEDVIIHIPVGTVIQNISNGSEFEVTKIGEKILLAKGGKGGRGNFFFRSATNTSPKEYQEGLSGESYDFRLELKLIADVGFIGLPNVGKSNMLNELTNAKSKVANYSFTTLEPYLGAYYELILADIPGLIEGASGGRGLGIKFLKHVERTKVLFHFIEATSEDVVKDYKTIRKELSLYNKELLDKTEYILLSKIDEKEPSEIKKKITLLKKLNPNIIGVSILMPETIEEVKKILNKIEKEKHK